ncbi:MAG TPA: FkbM family methyltransferase [Flavisolibacter sp.]|nr:FkbM family methyltransferase [Flavisolibacter sp.]
MFGVNLLLKSYLRPLPLNLDRYLFKKKIDESVYSLAVHNCRFPVFLRKNSTDIHVFNQVFYRNEYDIDFRSDPKVIIDCGANIGMTSVYFANKFPNAKIIAIEPERANFEMLLKNTGKYENVECLNCGIWNKSTNLEVIDRGEGAWAFIVKEVDQETASSIKAVSVDKVMQMFNIENIDVLKIDIEGSEKEVFEEGSEKWLPNVKTMVLELHDRVKNGCTSALINALKTRDYFIEPFCESIVVRM